MTRRTEIASHLQRFHYSVRNALMLMQSLKTVPHAMHNTYMIRRVRALERVSPLWGVCLLSMPADSSIECR